MAFFCCCESGKDSEFSSLDELNSVRDGNGRNGVTEDSGMSVAVGVFTLA